MLPKKLVNTQKRKYKTKSWVERNVITIAQWRKNRSVIRDTLLKAEILCSKCSNCQEEEVVIRCGTCNGSLCHVCDYIVYKMLPLHDITTFIDGYEHPFLPLETLNHEGDIEATGMFTTTKTTRLISIKFSVVLSPFRKKLS